MLENLKKSGSGPRFLLKRAAIHFAAVLQLLLAAGCLCTGAQTREEDGPREFKIVGRPRLSKIRIVSEDQELECDLGALMFSGMLKDCLKERMQQWDTTAHVSMRMLTLAEDGEKLPWGPDEDAHEYIARKRRFITADFGSKEVLEQARTIVSQLRLELSESETSLLHMKWALELSSTHYRGRGHAISTLSDLLGALSAYKALSFSPDARVRAFSKAHPHRIEVRKDTLFALNLLDALRNGAMSAYAKEVAANGNMGLFRRAHEEACRRIEEAAGEAEANRKINAIRRLLFRLRAARRTLASLDIASIERLEAESMPVFSASLGSTQALAFSSEPSSDITPLLYLHVLDEAEVFESWALLVSAEHPSAETGALLSTCLSLFPFVDEVVFKSCRDTDTDLFLSPSPSPSSSPHRTSLAAALLEGLLKNNCVKAFTLQGSASVLQREVDAFKKLPITKLELVCTPEEQDSHALFLRDLFSGPSVLSASLKHLALSFSLFEEAAPHLSNTNLDLLELASLPTQDGASPPSSSQPAETEAETDTEREAEREGEGAEAGAGAKTFPVPVRTLRIGALLSAAPDPGHAAPSLQLPAVLRRVQPSHLDLHIPAVSEAFMRSASNFAGTLSLESLSLSIPWEQDVDAAEAQRALVLKTVDVCRVRKLTLRILFAWMQSYRSPEYIKIVLDEREGSKNKVVESLGKSPYVSMIRDLVLHKKLPLDLTIAIYKDSGTVTIEVDKEEVQKCFKEDLDGLPEGEAQEIMKTVMECILQKQASPEIRSLSLLDPASCAECAQEQE